MKVVRCSFSFQEAQDRLKDRTRGQPIGSCFLEVFGGGEGRMEGEGAKARLYRELRIYQTPNRCVMIVSDKKVLNSGLGQLSKCNLPLFTNTASHGLLL